MAKEKQPQLRVRPLDDRVVVEPLEAERCSRRGLSMLPTYKRSWTSFQRAARSARQLGHHTLLSVPLMREGIAIGTINLRRTEAKLFTDRQVALLQTFADQAVIAIENVRLFSPHPGPPRGPRVRHTCRGRCRARKCAGCADASRWEADRHH